VFCSYEETSEIPLSSSAKTHPLFRPLAQSARDEKRERAVPTKNMVSNPASRLGGSGPSAWCSITRSCCVRPCNSHGVTGAETLQFEEPSSTVITSDPVRPLHDGFFIECVSPLRDYIGHETEYSRPGRNRPPHAGTFTTSMRKSSGKGHAITTSARTSRHYCNAFGMNRLSKSSILAAGLDATSRRSPN
jgi:hypothetical protein